MNPICNSAGMFCPLKLPAIKANNMTETDSQIWPKSRAIDLVFISSRPFAPHKVRFVSQSIRSEPQRRSKLLRNALSAELLQKLQKVYSKNSTSILINVVIKLFP